MAIWELRSASAEAGWDDVVVELDLAIQAIDSRELQAGRSTNRQGQADGGWPGRRQLVPCQATFAMLHRPDPDVQGRYGTIRTVLASRRG